MSGSVVKNHDDKLLTVCVCVCVFVTVRCKCMWHVYDSGLYSVLNFHHISFKNA